MQHPFLQDTWFSPIYPALQKSDIKKIGTTVSEVLESPQLTAPKIEAAAQAFLANSRLEELSSGLYMFLGNHDGGTFE